MPLIPCPSCGTEISSDAVSCPKCGHPMKPPTPAKPPGINLSDPVHLVGCAVAVIFLGVIAWLVLSAWYSGSHY